MSVAIAVGDNWQTKTAANPPGTIFNCAVGTHTNQSVVPKTGNEYIGDAATGVIMDGSTTTVYAFEPGSPGYPSNVKLKDIEIKRYAPPIQMAAVRCFGFGPSDGGTGWILDNLNVHDNVNGTGDGGGARLGPGARVLGGKYNDNGRMGMSGYGDNIVVDGQFVNGVFKYCEIARNNPTGGSLGFEAGGTKFVRGTSSCIFRHIWAHHNGGPGLWLDIGNDNFLIQDVLTEWNLQDGIPIEISYGGLIERAHCRHNGLTDTRRTSWLWGAGIAAQASGGNGLEIRNCYLEGNAHGIVMLQQARGLLHGDPTGVDDEMYTKNVYVHDNITVHPVPNAAYTPQQGAVQDVTDLAIFTSRNNQFANNKYWQPSTTGNSLAWNNTNNNTFAAWQGFGHDLSNSFFKTLLARVRPGDL